MTVMSVGGKKRKREDPLETSVNAVVQKMCAWEDACGGKFTLDTDTVVGTDYVELRVAGVDEVRLVDLLAVVDEVPHVVDYGCHFADGTVWFKFETDVKKKRIAELEDKPDQKEVDEEYDKIRPRLKTETDEDVRAVCDLVVALKTVVPRVHARNVRVDLTPTPGVVVVNFKGLPRFDKPMILKLRGLVGSDGDDETSPLDAVVFLAPKEARCVRIHVKKRKNTVNI
ncbi:MAG: hypothetical protein CMI16_02595 [Opitutaceae bacterium]|nr:hypothetical protein [Opitutaceae bacterium]